MAETKQITALHVVTDSENGYDNIGDIDGGMFDADWLYKHIESHGPNQLFRKLASMTSTVHQTMNQVMKDQNQNNQASEAVGS